MSENIRPYEKRKVFVENSKARFLFVLMRAVQCVPARPLTVRYVLGGCLAAEVQRLVQEIDSNL